MTAYTYSGRTARVAKAKLANFQPAWSGRVLLAIGVIAVAVSVVFLVRANHIALSLAGAGVSLVTLYIWVSRDIRRLGSQPIGSTTRLDELLPPEIIAKFRPKMTPLELWRVLEKTPGASFIILRFELDPEAASLAISPWQTNLDAVWDEAARISASINQPHIGSASIVCAYFNLCPALSQSLATYKLTPEDLEEGAAWFQRIVNYVNSHAPTYGGIARDWASGFTPMLNRYGTNISQEVELGGKGASSRERTMQLDALITSLDSANGNAILIGDPGIGKSALLLGLADRILQGNNSGNLAHYQIIALNASFILAQDANIENIVLRLFNEAARAGNIIIALDEAQLFFGHGTGAVNLSQILLPILQARSVKLVLAVSPGDWQKLRATNTSMASLLTPLVLSEPDETQTMRLVADAAVSIEGGLITTWSSLKEAYRLSGRYFQDEAYPGRARKLLEAAANYPDGSFITDVSVQKAIESQFGVKVQTSTASESDNLLHLEDKIHERMINQSRAVSVVSDALRRARAGVANPKRPIGSFLFLGPTGVGKTELARSLAAVYFNSENSMIRLDMSEYQQIPDVDRILASAAQNPEGLLTKVRQSPFSVVLFDEIEKAHPNILNLLLQLLDEGNLTDSDGSPTSFKDTIIIATSNAGADVIRERIEAGEELASFEEQFTNDLVTSGYFKPELLNRFDEIVLFRPLNKPELSQVVNLMLLEVNKTLANQKVTVALTNEAVTSLVEDGYDPLLGARPMRRMVQRRVENAVAQMILKGLAKPGTALMLDVKDLSEPETGS